MEVAVPSAINVLLLSLSHKVSSGIYPASIRIYPIDHHLFNLLVCVNPTAKLLDGTSSNTDAAHLLRGVCLAEHPKRSVL